MGVCVKSQEKNKKKMSDNPIIKRVLAVDVCENIANNGHYKSKASLRGLAKSCVKFFYSNRVDRTLLKHSGP